MVAYYVVSSVTFAVVRTPRTPKGVLKKTDLHSSGSYLVGRLQEPVAGGNWSNDFLAVQSTSKSNLPPPPPSVDFSFIALLALSLSSSSPGPAPSAVKAFHFNGGESCWCRNARCFLAIRRTGPLRANLAFHYVASKADTDEVSTDWRERGRKKEGPLAELMRSL